MSGSEKENWKLNDKERLIAILEDNAVRNFFVYSNKQVFQMLDMMTWQKIGFLPELDFFSRQYVL